MDDDVLSIAENKLDAMENEDLENKELDETTEGEDLSGDEDVENTKDAEDSEDSEESEDDTESEDEDPEDPEDAEEPEEEEKGLSDDELMAELEKRGLTVAKKEEEARKEDKPEPAREPKQPKELADEVWGDMNIVQKTIYSALPYITVRGKDPDGNVVTMNIKTPEQLPEDFEFINKREEASFISDVTAQSKRAEDYYARLAGHTEQRKQEETQAEEARKVVADVDRLQKDGIIPKIKAKPNTPEFDNDPSVKLVNEILNYWAKLGEEGEKISIYTATKLFKAENPDKFVDKTKSRGDEERKKVSKKIKGSNSGGNAGKDLGSRPRFPLGTSASDIADFYSKDLD